MTWSEKEDWPNPRQSVVFTQKAVRTKCSHLSWRLVFRAVPAFPTPVTWSLVYPNSWTWLLWFRLFWCPVLILPRVDFWFCYFYSCIILEAHTFLPGQDIRISENILFWDQFTCMLFPLSNMALVWIFYKF